MKKIMAWVLLLSIALCACGVNPGADAPKPVSGDGFPEEMRQLLQEDWDSYAAMSREALFASSHTPGYCTREFGSWTEVEAFVGMELENPLEELQTLEKGNWAAAPEGFNGADRFYVTWYGTSDGQVEWVAIDSGYRRGGLRVGVKMSVYSESSQTENGGPVSSAEQRREDYLACETDGGTVYSRDSSETYEARQGVLARGSVLYTVRVMGELGTGEELELLLKELIPYFEGLPG